MSVLHITKQHFKALHRESSFFALVLLKLSIRDPTPTGATTDTCSLLGRCNE